MDTLSVTGVVICSELDPPWLGVGREGLGDQRDLRSALMDAVARIHIPHDDDGRRHHPVATHHARSVAFLAAHGLVPDSEVRRYLDRCGVVDGMAIALPDVPGPLFQLAADWTNHNCLHDDAMESTDCALELVAELSHRYADALAGRSLAGCDHPLVSAMVSWRRRATVLGVDPALLERFACRAGRMARQFVLERQSQWFDEDAYLQWRVESGPFDAWFALLDLVLGPARWPDTTLAARLQRLAIWMTVTGNELRTAAREADQDITNNAILRADDPIAAIERMLRHHEDSASRFMVLSQLAADPLHRRYASDLARAVYATHMYELRSIRGCAWSS